MLYVKEKKTYGETTSTNSIDKCIVLNVGTMLFMGIVKNKIEEHMHEIRQLSELQADFTK